MVEPSASRHDTADSAFFTKGGKRLVEMRSSAPFAESIGNIKRSADQRHQIIFRFLSRHENRRRRKIIKRISK